MTNQKAIYFNKRKKANGYLCNEYSCEFTVNETKFSSMTQFIAYKKASFVDREKADIILRESKTSVISKYERKLKDNTDWLKARYAIVYQGLLEKFRQNKELRVKLLLTEDIPLVYCSKKDKEWGIGMSKFKSIRKNNNKWKGDNLLGITLMKVRSQLASEEREVFLKDFLYLDTSFLQSFMAQVENGFVIEKNLDEMREEVEEEATATKEIVATVAPNVPIAPQVAAKKSIPGTKTTNSVAIKKSSKYVQSDNMFIEFYNFLCNDANVSYLTNQDDYKEGKYIIIESEFRYVDFKRLSEMINEEKRTIYNGNEDDNEEELKFSKKIFEDIRQQIELVRTVFPYEVLLFNGKELVLIEKEWLRQKKKRIGFILGGKINIIGKVLKTIPMPSERDGGSEKVFEILDSVQQQAVEYLFEFGGGFEKSEQVHIIRPIAIY